MSLSENAQEMKRPLYPGTCADEKVRALEPLAALGSKVKIEYQSKKQLFVLLEEHRFESVDAHVSDVIDFIAELRGVNRASILQTAVVAWFYHALGFPILEAECQEQPRSDDSCGAFLAFRVRLDANHAEEVASLQLGEDLTKKYRTKLLAALPGDLMTKTKGVSLEQMVTISWTKVGSIELGGVAAVGLVVLIVLAIGVGMCHCKLCADGICCPCVGREGRAEGREYHCALRELRERGAEFEVNPDGSANLRVPAYNQSSKWGCPECAIL